MSFQLDLPSVTAAAIQLPAPNRVCCVEERGSRQLTVAECRCVVSALGCCEYSMDDMMS